MPKIEKYSFTSKKVWLRQARKMSTYEMSWTELRGLETQSSRIKRNSMNFKSPN
jgi:hypothetical protein